MKNIKLLERIKSFSSSNGHSEPLEVVSYGSSDSSTSNNHSQRPLFSALVAAGVMSMVAVSGINDAKANDAAVFLGKMFGVYAVDAVHDVDTNSPDLGGINYNDMLSHYNIDKNDPRFVHKSTVEGYDFRDDSSTFHLKTMQSLVKGGVYFDEIGPASMMIPSDQIQGNDIYANSIASDVSNNKSYHCIVMVGGQSFAGTPQEKLSNIMADKEIDIENNTTIKARDLLIDKAFLLHEFGHCLSKMMDMRGNTPSNANKPIPVPNYLEETENKTYRTYIEESRVDSFAMLMLAAEGDYKNQKEAEDFIDTMADARQIGQLRKGSYGVSQGSHYTTATLDATNDYIRQHGIDHIRSMKDDPLRILELTDDLTEKNTMDIETWKLVTDGVNDIVLGANDSIILPPDIYEADTRFLERSYLALSRQGFSTTHIIKDTIADKNPSWLKNESDNNPEETDPVLRELMKELDTPIELMENNLTSDVSSLLEPDLDEGATISNVVNTPQETLVSLLEKDGKETTAKIKNGSVLRYNEDGVLQSLSESRPAMQRGDALYHAIEGHKVELDEFVRLNQVTDDASKLSM